MFTKSQDSAATEFSNALVPSKKPSKAGRSDYSFNFFHIEILATLLEYLQMFASLIKKKKFSIADHHRLSSMGEIYTSRKSFHSETFLRRRHVSSSAPNPGLVESLERGTLIPTESSLVRVMGFFPNFVS